MIQAIFFDIDGTLIPHGQTSMPRSTIKALWALRNKGIKLFVATGRPPNHIQHIKDMFPFDGYLTANGQYCFTHEQIIYENSIPTSSIEKVIPYCEENHIPILFAMLDKCYRNIYNDSDFDSKWPCIDLNTVKDQKIIQVMARIHPSQDEEFLKHIPGCQSARWTDAFADIIPIEGGKDYGIDRMIEYFHISLENTMAFGDGGNDIAMLKHVPYGIAMGNAYDFVKEHAFYVTTDIEDDGIYNALIHFQVLDDI